MTAIATARSGGARRPLSSHHPLGISTGVFAEARGNWPVLAAQAADVSTFAAELSALSIGELPGLIAYLRSGPSLAFHHLAVHAPTKGVEGRADEIVQQLLHIPLWVRAFVSHPDVIDEASAYRRLGPRLVLENMDDRKETGRTVGEMRDAYELLPEAGFCLDVAHAWSVDPTMTLAHELLDRFRSRLRQVHLSSLVAGKHATLTEEHEQLFEDVLGRCLDVPWILEGPVPERWRGALGGQRSPSKQTALAPL